MIKLYRIFKENNMKHTYEIPIYKPTPMKTVENSFK